MRRWTWVIVLALVALLAVLPWAATALAQGSRGGGASGPGPSSQEDWADMYEACHGSGGMMSGEDGGQGMMGGWEGGYGMMGGVGVGLGNATTLGWVAAVLGLTSEALQARLDGGEAIAQIAVAQGVPTQRVVDAILAPLAAMLDVQVRFGYLTAEQAQATLTDAGTRVEQAIALPAKGTGAASPLPPQQRQGTRPGMGTGGMMGGGMMGGGMMGGMGGWR